jgi:hypothetical protein
MLDPQGEAVRLLVDAPHLENADGELLGFSG